MDVIITIFFSFVILSIGTLFIVNNLGKNKKIYLIDWATLTFIVLYAIGFPIVYIYTVKGDHHNNYTDYIAQFASTEIIYYFMLVMCLIIFTNLGWSLSIKKHSNGSLKYKKLKNDNTHTSNSRYISKHIKFAWVMLVVSIIFYYLYSVAYGGFIGLLSYTIAIRSGVSSISNRFSFFEKFGQFSVIATFIFFALVIDKEIKKENKKGTVSGLIISMIFSLFFLYSKGGRASIVFFILVLILIITYCNSIKLSIFFKKIFKKLILLPIAFLVMDKLWSRSSDDAIFSILVNSISYPFAAFIVNFNNGLYRFFKDFLQLPFYFLPSSLWAVKYNLKTANDQTTYLISGAYKGERIGNQLVTGTTPNDILTFSYMQADMIGVIIVGLLFGLFLRYFHNKILKQRYAGIKYMLYSYFAVNFTIKTITGGDISLIVISNWGFIIYFFLFNIYSKIRIR